MMQKINIIRGIPFRLAKMTQREGQVRRESHGLGCVAGNRGTSTVDRAAEFSAGLRLHDGRRIFLRNDANSKLVGEGNRFFLIDHNRSPRFDCKNSAAS